MENTYNNKIRIRTLKEIKDGLRKIRKINKYEMNRI